jgi:hypothetical protein
MSMTKGRIAELRALCKFSFEATASRFMRSGCLEALDEVERLQAEAEQIAAWLAAHGTTPEQVRDAMRWSLEDREKLQAENSELRQALRKIQDEGDAHSNAVATATIEGPTT